MHERTRDSSHSAQAAHIPGDSEAGALPPLGQVYDLETVVDNRLISAPDVYFEAGDHLTLIHVEGKEFRRLMAGAARGAISHHV